MPTLADQEIVDLVTGTLEDLGRNKFSQIAQSLQDYEVMGKWLKKDRVIFDSGIGIRRTLMTKLPGAARHLGLYERDEVNVIDLLETLNVPWRHATTNWAFERRETLMNRGKALILNIIKPRRIGAMINLTEELETKGFASPGGSNTTDPYGIPYFITKNASTGFHGGTPSGHSTVAGINVSNTPAYQNYTAQYTDVSKPDLIKLMRTGKRKIGWKSPVTVPEYRGAKGKNMRLYMNEETLSDMEDLGEAQNENLGRDLAPMDGQMTFHKHPMIWVPELDSDTQNPIYFVDHQTFYPVILRGDYLRESGVKVAPEQHNTFVVYVDISYNYLCLDRRRNAVFATA